MAAGLAPSESRKACHPRPPREQGRQEVSGCPCCSSQVWPAHGCCRLIRNPELGRSLHVAGYVTFGSLVLSEVSLPLRVAEGCPSVCVLALRARPPGCSVCHPGGRWPCRPCFLLLSSLCGCWETLQAGLYLNSGRRASLTLRFVSLSRRRCHPLWCRLICGMTWLWSTWWLYSSCGRETVGAGRGPS